jgi:cholinesterase
MSGIKTKDRTDYWYKFSAKIGCGGAEAGPAKTLECARAKDTKVLLDAIKVSGDGKSTRDGHGPVVDDKIIFSDYRARGKAGQFIKRVGFAINPLLFILA